MRFAEVTIPDGFDIEAQVEKTYTKQIRQYPCHINRASEIGHQCSRYLVYCRTHWEQRQIHDVGLEFIFEGGRYIEQLALRRLETAGFELSNQGRDFHDKKYSISGHVDAFIGKPRHTDGSPNAQFPLEIKGISPYDWDKIDSAEDMLLSPKPWLKKYPGQLQMYLFLSEQPLGVFYIINKLTYRGKAIWLPLDYDYCEDLIKKAEQVNAHCANGTLPERNLDADVCMKCPFRHICLPDLKNVEGITFIDNEDFERDLDRLNELKPAKSEYEKIDKRIKKLVEGKDNLNVGDWLITGKWVEKKECTIPACKYWKKEIIHL